MATETKKAGAFTSSCLTYGKRQAASQNEKFISDS